MAVVSAPYSAVPSGRAGWLGLDWPLLLLTLLLSIWGCMTIFSATQPSQPTTIASVPAASSSSPAAASSTRTARTRERSRLTEGVKQTAFVVIGTGLMLALALSNYKWLMHLQGWLYGLNLATLLLVLVLPGSIAPEINGAKSWIVLGPISLQMSEFAKFAVLVSLAAFLTRKQERIGEFGVVLLSLAYIVPPLLLILKQPDFGTMLAVFSIWFGMLFFGGARLWHMGLIVLVFSLLFAGAWRFHVLKPHQTERLASFLNPDAAPEAGGYQLKQSLIAIGGGQITGQGYGQGMQNRANYVPENHTDFIFTVVAEELGFAGAATLIACYLLLLLRSASLASTADNYFGVLLCGGFTALLAFHCIVNLGMTMRVMPITGVPLPFFSYGGSSFLAFSLCAGLVQSVSRNRR